MTVTPYQGGGGVAPRSHSSSLYDVLELILDKGLVIDAYIRVSLVGIELLTIDIRIVIASVDTYLRFAEAVNRVDLTQSRESRTLPELVGDLQEQGAGGKVKGALSGVGETFSDAFQRGLAGGGRESESEGEERVPRPRGRSR
ncbi:gas vesicle protein GvpJ [Actinopolymorpha pittospori]